MGVITEAARSGAAFRRTGPFALGLSVALLATACGGESSDSVDGAETLEFEMLLSPVQFAVAVAQDQGCYESLDIDYTRVGIGEEAALFRSGDAPLGGIAPHEIAEWVAEGEEIRYFSTAAAVNFRNGVVVRAEDADTYTDIAALQGETLGHPGLGTGTWGAFEVLADTTEGIEAAEDYELVSADGGALLGLLSSGEIEGTLLFDAATAAAEASDEFEVIYSFSPEWEEIAGHPLAVTGWSVRTEWLDEHGYEALADFDSGTECGLQWAKDNLEEFQEGGSYADWAESAGWLRDDATEEYLHDSLLNDEVLLPSDTYTTEWIESTYEFITESEGVLIDDGEVPDMWDVFIEPDEIESAG